MKCGVVDFLEKPVKHEILIGAVEEALRRSGAAASRARAEADVRGRLARLTRAERVVLLHICAGLTTAEIARVLHRSARTIENHRQSVLSKMGARNAVDLGRMVATVMRGDGTPIRPDRATERG